MGVEDFLEPEVAVAVVVTAAASSPRARRLMRQGAVYGIAGALKAGDALSSFARGIGRGVQQATAEGAGVAGGVEESVEGRRPAARTRPARPARAATPAATEQPGEAAPDTGGTEG